MQLDELYVTLSGQEWEWKETARWIKYEEDVEEGGKWGRPHVASLSFHSLLNLRKCLEQGEQPVNYHTPCSPNEKSK